MINLQIDLLIKVISLPAVQQEEKPCVCVFEGFEGRFIQNPQGHFPDTANAQFYPFPPLNQPITFMEVR
jgi:hypothetical protein